MRELAVVGALCAAAGPGLAAPRTPQAWRQVVHADGDFRGQRKNTTWIRDGNRDFIDDEIALRFAPTDHVDNVVALNEFSGVAVAAARLAPYGRVVHVSRLVSAVLVRDVPVSSLPEIARLSQVAMVEWAAPLRLASDVSSRSIQARASVGAGYDDRSAQKRGFEGSDETIAILDTGVDNATHDAFLGKFKEGFDAVVFEDLDPMDRIDDSCKLPPVGDDSCAQPDDEPGDGSRDPTDEYRIGHGTRVASIALGAALTGGEGCRQPGGGQAPDCAGIAARAGLVDVRVCLGAACLQADVLEGLDWLGKNAARLGVRVANLSFTGCLADDGSGAVAQAVDELVSKGVFVVVAAGNASNCGVAPGTNLVGDPASAGMALTVAALADDDTVSRHDDDLFDDRLVGPRSGPNPLTVAMLKPDLSAPGYGISGAKLGTTNQYTPQSGTSYAAPAAAGAAAIVLQARPGIDPSSLKMLLRDAADSSSNAPYAASVDPVWDKARGWGELNIWPAIEEPPVVDVGFPSCAGASTIPGGPCALAQPSNSPSSSSWNNSTDIRIAILPWTPGTNNTIVADVRNFGKQAATVRVSFGVAPLSVGAVDLEPLGEQTVMIPAETTMSIAQPWVPLELEGATIGVAISFGLDSNFGNNFTLCRFAYAQSTFELRVENPLDVPARMELRAQGGREGWTCRVDTPPFVMDPFDDPARTARVRFDAPPNAPPGASASCTVELWAAPLSGRDGPRLVGGVTLRTFVPDARRSPSE
jgi:subtilisin family serine protease